jgi:hypothetical protein
MVVRVSHEKLETDHDPGNRSRTFVLAAGGVAASATLGATAHQHARPKRLDGGGGEGEETVMLVDLRRYQSHLARL